MAETLEPSLVGEIDTSAPFESVREVATRFGGFGFWKPSSLTNPQASQKDVNEANMVEKASELEKELIAKEEDTLNVLKSLESTKAIVEALKSKLHRKEEKENIDMNVLKELNQAKMNLCKTTEDLAAIRVSVELLNKRLEEERSALEKTRERLNNTENAAEISKEIQRLSYEAKEFSKTGENARSAVEKAVTDIEQTRNKIKTAEMRLVAARKMKEAARAAEAVAIAEIKAVTRRRRRRGNGEEETLQEEILETIEETAREIRSSRRTIEEGLEKVNTAKTEAEETLQGKWQWSEHRRRSSVNNIAKYKNRRERLLMDVNGLNLMMNEDGTSSSVAVLKPTMSIGQILSRKLLLADESAMMKNGRVSLGSILGKTKNGVGNGERKEKEKRFNGKRKRFGLANLSVMLNKENKKKNKKKKIALNLN